VQRASLLQRDRHDGRAGDNHVRHVDASRCQTRAGREEQGAVGLQITIESLNARFRRAVNARGHFPTEQAALKVLYLTVVSLDPTGKGRVRWSNRWKAALNAFDITFDGRVSAGRR
jgi:transposase-like protein